ncbi:phosphotransferase [Tepidiforma sp.]|uniref:phosphotransferase family protein n=1 Tax=Tepidiforma sp. TaxID=2682230 RepID=UPI00262D5A0E|nr:phosphotransferase [Tepidiforma sp.]MCX7617856.1 phosphotransferase [Tepidiforma sp.]
MTIDPGALPRLGQGRAAEVFALDARRVVKLARRPGPLAPFEREAAALRAAAAAGVPVPAVEGVTVIDGRPGLIMARVEGRDLLDVAAARPWRLPALARQFAAIHAHLTRADGSGFPGWRERVLEVLASSPRVPARVRAAARPHLSALPGGDRLVHADFHPGNVMMTPAGPVLIDFADVYQGDPLASHARTLVLLELGALPPGATRAERILAAAGRRLFAAQYAAAYRRSVPAPPDVARAWRSAAIIERLDADIPGERLPLLRALARALRPS